MSATETEFREEQPTLMGDYECLFAKFPSAPSQIFWWSGKSWVEPNYMLDFVDQNVIWRGLASQPDTEKKS